MCRELNFFFTCLDDWEHLLFGVPFDLAPPETSPPIKQPYLPVVVQGKKGCLLYGKVRLYRHTLEGICGVACNYCITLQPYLCQSLNGIGFYAPDFYFLSGKGYLYDNGIVVYRVKVFLPGFVVGLLHCLIKKRGEEKIPILPIFTRVA